MSPPKIKMTSLASWLDRLQPSQPVITAVLAVTVGVLSGAGVWAFRWMFEFFHSVAFDRIGGFLAQYGRWTIVLIPLTGGVLVGLIVKRYVGQERHHGVAGIMEAVALAGGRLRYKRIPAKAFAAALSIGSGASVGPEDPSVQIGANLGSMFGQYLRLSDERVRTLVAAGAAGGISAAFNAPIAGVFFALEIILGAIGSTTLGIILVASVASSVVTRILSGEAPAFNVPTYALNSPWELLLYLGLGLVAGLIAAAYIGLLYLFQDIYHQWHVPGWLKTASAGLIVGVVGIFLPQIFGVGYDTVETILSGEKFTFSLVLMLLLAKLILTPVSIGGGFQGGVFAPSLFLGATMGYAFGASFAAVFPSLGITPAAFAMVGMAAVLAGAVHAPLTAILLLFEMTNDYRIILPLMFAVAVSLLVSRQIQQDSVYSLGLARKGIRLDRGRDVDVLEGLQVREVMQAGLQNLSVSDTLEQARKIFQETRHHGLPVIDQSGDLYGLLTIQDIDRAVSEKSGQVLVGDICTRELLVTYPDERLGKALRLMSTRDIGRLPVVDRDQPRHLVGVLRRSDLVRAYDLALSRRASLRHRAHQVRLGAVSGDPVSVIELGIQPGSVCESHAIQEIVWPQECIIASLRRRGRLLIPHGNTVLQAGDVLVVVAEEDVRPQLQALIQSRE